jgi:hypothetical protein
MQFGCELIDSFEQLHKWDRITMAGCPPGARHSSWQRKSAPWILRSFGPCRLYMCFLTPVSASGAPAIVVPIYVCEPCAIAQGITRLALHCPPGCGALAMRLLADASAYLWTELAVRWLFLSPIGTFRATVLQFLAEHRVRHGDLGTTALHTLVPKRYDNGATWVDVDADDRCTLRMRPKCDPAQTSMTWDPRDYRDGDERFDLGVMIEPIDKWNVVEQRWRLSSRGRKQAEDEAELRRIAPYNFLNQLHGDGILVIDTRSLGQSFY